MKPADITDLSELTDKQFIKHITAYADGLYLTQKVEFYNKDTPGSFDITASWAECQEEARKRRIVQNKQKWTKATGSDLPILESLTHINVYSKSITRLGRELSNLSFASMRYEGKPYASIEAIWYTVLANRLIPKPDKGTKVLLLRLQALHGTEAKATGKKILKGIIDHYKAIDESFKDIILDCLDLKIKNNPGLCEALRNNVLPLKHYYFYGNPDNAKVIDLTERHQWQLDGIAKITGDLRKTYRGHNGIFPITVEFKYWEGDRIESLESHEVLVFGSNPEGRHGLGLAKVARNFYKARYGQGRGLQGRCYGLITKNLTVGFKERLADGSSITYNKAGVQSLSQCDIVENINELYECCLENPDKVFIVPYVNGGRSLNGWSPDTLLGCFVNYIDVPSNIRFHISYKAILN